MGLSAAAAATTVPSLSWAFPSVFPHGTTIYKPEKCWNGYTVFGVETAGQGCVLIDMNGNVVHEWKNVSELEHPTKLLKGGYVMGATRQKPEMVGRTFGDPMSADLSICDWNGKILRNIPLAGMHHDFQVEGNPTGYYSPTMDVEYKPEGKILVLSHLFTENPAITNKKPLDDDYIFEVDKDNNILWDWKAFEHFDELHLPEDMKKAMRRFPTWQMTRTPGVRAADWMHMNSASYLGPNHWYDEDPVKYAAFNPENIICSCRQLNTCFIIDKATKKIVWQIGPTFCPDDKWIFGGQEYKRALYKLGQIVGQHHCHMIPAGLPGAGNILVFDNGGWAGYDNPNPGAPIGVKAAQRDYTRILEFDPITLKIVWQYTPHEAGFVVPLDASRFYSPFISSAQRLPNGNTLITEGSDGRLLEVTADHEIVWEFINPYHDGRNMNMVYRAYRVPYEWVPQAEHTPEVAIARADCATFRMPGAAAFGSRSSEVEVEGTLGYVANAGDCIAATDD